jgi:hypothetical protein
LNINELQTIPQKYTFPNDRFGLKIEIMDYKDFSEKAISKQDIEFAKEFESFVNGRMRSADDTGRELSRAHRYLQQQMFKVFIGFMRQLAHNYQKGYYDDRNEWASRVAAEAYATLVEKELVYDPDYKEREIV